MAVEIDISKFLLNLGQITKHRAVTSRIISSLDWHSATKPMIDLCELEIESLLLNDALELSQRKELREFHLYRKEETIAFYKESPDHEDMPKFEMIFCDIDHPLPSCLVHALGQNTEFVQHAETMADSLAECILEKVFDDDISKDEFEHLFRSFPSMLDSPDFFRFASFEEAFQHLPFLARLRLKFGLENDRCEFVNIVNDGDWRKLDNGICDNCTTNTMVGPSCQFTEVMHELRELDLFRKEDFVLEHISEYIVDCENCSQSLFAERFEYMLDWDPSLLAREKYDSNDFLLHEAAVYGDFQVFASLLELGARQFPSKLGFLYHLNEHKESPFQLACKTYGKEEVTEIAGSLLFSKIDSTRKAESLFVSLAMDERVHVEAIYTVLRRDPSVLARVSSKILCNGNRKRKRSNQKRKRSKSKKKKQKVKDV